MNYKVNDNAQRSQTKPKKNHFCYIYNKVKGGTNNRRPSPQAAATPIELPRVRTYSKL